MTVKPGNWAKALKESTVHHQDVLTLFFNIKGEVFLSVNRGRFNQFFNGVDATKPLWALIDVYGNTTGLKVEGKFVCRAVGVEQSFPAYMVVTVN